MIRDLQREINFTAENDFAALHGYLTDLFGRIPRTGDVICDQKYKYEILSVGAQRIEKVSITEINDASKDLK